MFFNDWNNGMFMPEKKSNFLDDWNNGMFIKHVLNSKEERNTELKKDVSDAA